MQTMKRSESSDMLILGGATRTQKYGVWIVLNEYGLNSKKGHDTCQLNQRDVIEKKDSCT